MNKALDYGKLKEQQAQGKLLKKHLKFPMYAQIKYDGNYVTVVVKDGKPTYYSSKPKEYLHPTDITFEKAKDGVYIAERYYHTGKLGLRTETALFGPKELQTARSDNKYVVHDYLTLCEYERGYSDRTYKMRLDDLINSGIKLKNIIVSVLIHSEAELDIYLDKTVKQGYEGIVAKSPNWKWKNTKSRTVEFIKYKKRPTADLLCIGTTDGTGKYEGMIGALILVDSYGREVQVGSGLNDSDRAKPKEYFKNKIVEIEYEQIMDTYIHPTFIGIRDDKTTEDID
jgi:DNA ligase-1